MEIAIRSRVLLLEDANSVGVDLSMGILPFDTDSAPDALTEGGTSLL